MKPFIVTDEFSDTLHSGLSYVVADGSRILFWSQEWIPGIVLKRRLFDWEISQWNRFQSVIEKYHVSSSMEDKLVWKSSTTGEYSAKFFCKDHLDTWEFKMSDWTKVWAGLTPPKVETFCWQLLKGGIAYREGYDRIGVSFGVFNGLLIKTPGHFLWSGILSNEIVIHGKRVDVNLVIDVIKVRVASWIKAKWPTIHMGIMDMVRCPLEIVIPAKATKKTPVIEWSKPVSGELKFNVDGASLGKPGPAELEGS
ncbi:hypothetical protein DITRI_Ditri06bG0148400 [Diplodiscus trichospermus]